MLSKLLAMAAAVTLPVASAAPYPGAPVNIQAPPRGLSPDVAHTLAVPTESNFEAGQCTFSAEVSQQCYGAELTTAVSIPSIYDNANKTITTPAFGLPVNIDNGCWNITGLGQDFLVELQDNTVTYVYGQVEWTGEQSSQPQSKNSCAVGPWSSQDLTCGQMNLPNLRSQQMNCTFQCSPPKPPQQSDNRLAQRKETVDNIKRQLDVVASATISPIRRAPTSYPMPQYVHGACYFIMTLSNQCNYNDKEKWHSEMIGDITSLQDQNHTAFETWPSGAGRIDKTPVQLPGYGDFMLGYNPAPPVVAFRFNDKYWSTLTTDDGKEDGLCKWFPWDKPELNCTEGTHQERDSRIVCAFKC